MDQNFQTSFIPKRSLSEETPTRTSSVSIYLFISVVFLLASLAGAGLVTFYKSSLTKQVAQMRDDLKKAEGAFEGEFIQDLQTIDRRIIASNEVLSNHIAVTPIFEALQIATLKSIQFTKFSYDITGTGAGAKIAVQMSGRAPSYKAIALESDQLTKNKYIRDPLFSNLTLDEQGNVSFELSFLVDPKLVLFSEILAKDQTTDTPSAIPATFPAGGAQLPGDLSVQ